MCDFFAGSNLFQYLGEARKYYFNIAPPSLVPRKCPILPGKYFVTNLSLTSGLNSGKAEEMNRALTPTELPNGLYRHVIKLFNDEDPVGSVIYWHTNINIRMNDDKF